MEKIMKKIYIGIDYSLKSPGVCIFHNGNYKWISHCSKVTKPKKDIKTQEDVRQLSDVDMSFHGELLSGTDYTSSDFADMMNYRQHAKSLFDMIISHLPEDHLSNYQFHIGYEGYSFNSFSRSNNIMNIAAATTTFKNLIMDHFWSPGLNHNTIDIVSPKKIKSFVGYGKFDKVDFFDIFCGEYNHIEEKWSDAIEKDHERKVRKGKPSVFNFDWKDEDLSGDFHTFCLDYEINRSVKKPKVPKPIDDMVDGYFVCCLLKDKFSADWSRFA